MKKNLPYIVGSMAFVVLLVIVLFAKKSPPRMDERITLREKDKIPYGFYAARNLLPSLFPQAAITSDSEAPSAWENIDVKDSGQAVFLVGHAFSASTQEINEMIAFIQKGNYIFIISPVLSDESESFLRVRMARSTGLGFAGSDSLTVSLAAPRFSAFPFSYPGKGYENYFEKIDSSSTIILGKSRKGEANFLQLNSMNGSLFLHASPLAFSNYFILHKNNIAYYQQALSVIPATIKKIVWNEYFMSNRQKPAKDPNWLRVLFRFPAFKWALLTAIGLIAVYLLSEMRRRQRYIPAFIKPKNESLDFVQTIGRLYYDKKDHQDLGKKLSQYFLDHVRQQYKLSTMQLDADFVAALHAKCGYPVKDLNELTGFIQFIQDANTISSQQLADFYYQLEKFYQTT
ncbi:MAG: hypothetical protein JWP88_1707 [Flaviaesturariibacter sp.]|nr:hypothetical protein [Flaviaesturariibacter sp.]